MWAKILAQFNTSDFLNPDVVTEVPEHWYTQTLNRLKRFTAALLTR